MSVNADLLIYNISQLVTFSNCTKPILPHSSDDLNIIKQGAIASKDGIIVWIGKESDISRYITEDDSTCSWNANGMAALPGFIDPHTHLVFAGTREDEFADKIAGTPYMEIAQKGGGIKRTVRETRAAAETYLLTLAKSRLLTALSFGITSLEIKSGYGLDRETELKILRVIRSLSSFLPMEIAATYLGAHEIPEDVGKQEYIDFICSDMIPQVASSKLAEFCDIFCEKDVYTPNEARKILSTAKQNGLLPKIHADQLTPSGGAELAAELGAVSADHLDFISERGIHALKEAGTIPVLLPGAVFFLGLNTYPPAKSFLEKNSPFALATDFNPGSCMTQNLHLILTIACTQCRFSIEQTLAAVTINAAFAINRHKVCGSLDIGKRMDVVILDVPDYRMIPYHFGHNHIKDVFCLGQHFIPKLSIELP